MKGNRRMRSRTGGGINFNKNVAVGVRRGAPATGVRPAGLSQFGSAIGNHATGSAKALRGGAEKYSGAGPAGGGQKLGNEVALNVGKGGPGTGRTVMRSGSQQGTTAPQSMSAGRDILSEFGPDSASVRHRR
jgi:hypothetical protein